MPNYYNPYNLYPATYSPVGQNSYASNLYQQQSMMNNPEESLVMKWVDGEGAARAFNMPANWPANKPIPLWDSTDTVIWIKSWGPMGIPNPMQKLRYEMPEQQSYYLPVTETSGSVGPTNYATKDDLDAMKNEIREMLQQHRPQQNQNGSNNSQTNQNRGGNR